MANEITLNIRLDYSNGGIVDLLEAAKALSIDVIENRIVHRTQTIGTSEEALGLGDLGTPSWLIGVNRNTTAGQLHIRAATGATDLVELSPGEPCCFRMSTNATAPFAISVGGEALFEYLLIDG